ncbi:MAG: hypothetical protein H6667_17430 [Ardenticatenaceae bacterium]|nr:hypothetical protein [Ardenticatenaceae bacterium]MCB9443236.1 hypothetical protein [Ardenticatenaceae bacterium]
MGILSAVVLVLLTMVGYASGVTLAGRGRHVLPSVWDLLLLLLVWWGAFWLRGLLDSRLWGLLVGLLVGIAVGGLFTAVRLTTAQKAPIIPESELPAHARETAVTPEAPFWRKLWQRWTAFATRMGGVQGRLFMGYFYFIFVTLFGLGMRFFSDPLHMKRPYTQSGWSAKDVIEPTLEAAQEQG